LINTDDLQSELRKKADEHTSDVELFTLLIDAADFVYQVGWALDRISDQIRAIEERLNQSDNP